MAVECQFWKEMGTARECPGKPAQTAIFTNGARLVFCQTHADEYRNLVRTVVTQQLFTKVPPRHRKAIAKGVIRYEPITESEDGT